MFLTNFPTAYRSRAGSIGVDVRVESEEHAAKLHISVSIHDRVHIRKFKFGYPEVKFEFAAVCYRNVQLHDVVGVTGVL